MASLIADALNTARTLAVKGQTHEAIAHLLRRRHQLRAEGEARAEDGGPRRGGGQSKEQRTREAAIDALGQRIEPMLRGLADNAYEALCIEEGAPEAEAKKAYRKLVLKFHPDKSEGTTELFHCVQSAFERFKSGKQLIISKGSGSAFASRYKERQQRKRGTGRAAGGRAAGGRGDAARRGPLQAPQNMRMVETSTASVTVAWDPPAGAADQVSCYELQFKEAEEREWHVASNSLTRTTCQKHNLVPGATYRFRVRALNAQTADWSPFCGATSATTMRSVPPRPRITRAVAKPHLSCIEVQWESGTASSNNAAAATYVLQWREKGKRMPWAEADASSDYESVSCSRVLRDLKASRAYQFRVRAANSVGGGAWSDVFDSTTAGEASPRDESLPTRPVKVVRSRAVPLRHTKPAHRPRFSDWATWDAAFASLHS